MDAEPNTELKLTVDGRTIVARTSPEDEGPLATLLGDRKSITLRPSESDTEGHLLFNEVAIDVEGHAMTLRLPTAADAAAVRRMLAVGALTATIAVGGVMASSMVQPQTSAVPVPGAARVTQSVPMDVNSDVGFADSASAAAAAEFAASGAAAGTTAAQDVPAVHNLGNRAQYDAGQDIGLADGASAAAAAEFAGSEGDDTADHNLGNRAERK